MLTMFAVIHIPDFPLQAVLRDPEEIRPAVLAVSSKKDNKTRIVALNRAARDRNIHDGMTVAQGQARFGELLVHHRSPEAEERAREQILGLANDCTPDFEDTAPGTCTLDLSGWEGWRGRPDPWEMGWELVEELSEKFRLRARLGFAETPDLALMAARHADPVRVLTGPGGDDFLLELPVSALEPPRDMAMVLTLWGVSSIGDFLALPAAELTERLGPDAREMWEKVSGKRKRPLNPVRPPADFSATAEFEYEVTTLEPLLSRMGRMLETICSRLASAWLAAGELHLVLHFSNGPAHRRCFRIPDPTTDAGLLLKVLEAHLEHFDARGPVSRVGIEVVPARGTRRQFHLFESGLRDPNRFTETLARLEAFLGPDRVGIPEMLDTHRPDAFRVRPFLEREPAEPSRANRLGLPLWRFRPAVFAEVTLCPVERHPVAIRSPLVRGNLREVRGPWLGSGDWWTERTRWRRAEWDVELEEGGLYRLVCEGERDWSVEGVYG